MRPVSSGHRRVALVDTSAYFALTDTGESQHVRARTIASRLGTQRWELVTTNFIVAEAHALFLVRLGHHHATAFLRQFESSGTIIVAVRSGDEERARQIIYQYDDKDFSLTDASSFAVMESRKISYAFTFDHNFRQYGVEVLTPDNI